MKKKIAIDMDGVIFDSENLYRVYSEIYDVDVKKSDNVIDNTKRMYQERYNWTEEDFALFYKEYGMDAMVKSNLMAGVDIVLKKLEEFYDLIFVTARTDEEIESSRENLNKLGLKKYEIYNNEFLKIDRFKKENVSFVVDDSEVVCMNAASEGFIAFYLKNNAAKKISGKNIISVNNWGEIYKYLMLKDNK